MTFHILIRKNIRNTVYLRVRHLGCEFFVSTGIHTQFPLLGGNPQRCEPNGEAKRKAIARIIGTCEDYALRNPNVPLEQAKRDIARLVQGRERESKDTLCKLMLAFIDGKQSKSTKTVYKTTLGKLTAYAPSATLEEIDRAWLDAFERHLRNSGCGTNYISIQLRNIRAVFNHAIDNGLTTNYPFRKYKIRQERTEKRNLTAEQLRTLRDIPLTGFMAEYRDMFLLMVYLIGINAADLFTLSHADYHDGRIHYRRSKTGGLYSIKVESEAQAIIARYRGISHLLCPLDRYKDYRDYLHHLNDALKHIGQTYRNGVGWSGDALFPSLSSYWSRHTWATIAASLDIPLDIISLALGHSFGNKVTQIYVEWSHTKVDEANRKVIDLLNA